MPFPFDATLKDLAHAAPPAFLTAFDAPPTLPVGVLDQLEQLGLRLFRVSSWEELLDLPYIVSQS